VNSLDTVCQDGSATITGVSTMLVGIDKTAESAWAGNVTNWAGAAASGKAWSDFNSWFLSVADGNIIPNMVLMGPSVYGVYTNAGFNQQRLVDRSNVDLGFLGASLNQTPVFMDLHITDGSATATDNRAYLLNTKFLFLRTHTAENMKRSPWVEPVDQIGDMVTKISWAGELTTNDCSRQSALYNFT